MLLARDQVYEKYSITSCDLFWITRNEQFNGHYIFTKGHRNPLVPCSILRVNFSYRMCEVIYRVWEEDARKNLWNSETDFDPPCIMFEMPMPNHAEKSVKNLSRVIWDLEGVPIFPVSGSVCFISQSYRYFCVQYVPAVRQPLSWRRVAGDILSYPRLISYWLCLRDCDCRPGFDLFWLKSLTGRELC